MKKCLTFNCDAQAALAPLYEFVAVKGFFLLGASYCAQTFTGTPTNTILTVKDDTVSILTVTHATAGTPAATKTTALGGTTALPTHVDADSIVALDISFTAGTSPTVTKAAIVLWIDEDE